MMKRKDFIKDSSVYVCRIRVFLFRGYCGILTASSLSLKYKCAKDRMHVA